MFFWVAWMDKIIARDESVSYPVPDLAKYLRAVNHANRNKIRARLDGIEAFQPDGARVVNL
jgi:hypothetical protein